MKKEKGGFMLKIILINIFAITLAVSGVMIYDYAQAFPTYTVTINPNLQELDDDKDGLADEDPWNGIDDDHDGIIDEDHFGKQLFNDGVGRASAMAKGVPGHGRLKVELDASLEIKALYTNQFVVTALFPNNPKGNYTAYYSLQGVLQRSDLEADVFGDFDPNINPLWNPESVPFTIYPGDYGRMVNKRGSTFPFDIPFEGGDITLIQTWDITLDTRRVNDPNVYAGARFVRSADQEFTVPEPSTLLLLGSGLVGIFVFGRKRLFKKTRP